MKNIVCANTLCRKLLTEQDERVKLDRYTYCKECGDKRKK